MCYKPLLKFHQKFCKTVKIKSDFAKYLHLGIWRCKQHDQNICCHRNQRIAFHLNYYENLSNFCLEFSQPWHTSFTCGNSSPQKTARSLKNIHICPHVSQNILEMFTTNGECDCRKHVIATTKLLLSHDAGIMIMVLTKMRMDEWTDATDQSAGSPRPGRSSKTLHHLSASSWAKSSIMLSNIQHDTQ